MSKEVVWLGFTSGAEYKMHLRSRTEGRSAVTARDITVANLARLKGIEIDLAALRGIDCANLKLLALKIEMSPERMANVDSPEIPVKC